MRSFVRSFVVVLLPLIIFFFYRREWTRRRKKNSGTRLTPYVSLSRAYTNLVHNNTFLSFVSCVLSSVFIRLPRCVTYGVYLVLRTILYKSMHWQYVAYFSHFTAIHVVVNCWIKTKSEKEKVSLRWLRWIIALLSVEQLKKKFNTNINQVTSMFLIPFHPVLVPISLDDSFLLERHHHYRRHRLTIHLLSTHLIAKTTIISSIFSLNISKWLENVSSFLFPLFIHAMFQIKEVDFKSSNEFLFLLFFSFEIRSRFVRVIRLFLFLCICILQLDFFHIYFLHCTEKKTKLLSSK